MIGAAGIAFVFATVFGGYLLAGGKMDIILKALPYEFTMIGGAAIGAFLVSNAFGDVKKTLKDILAVFKGNRWSDDDYRDLLCLLHELLRLSKSDPIALEEHIEDPAASSLFSAYPRIARDAQVTALICDTLRMMSMSFDDPHQVEAMLDERIEETVEHDLHSSHALQTMADGLPALGIVAAVLGVIKTMGSIDQPPDVLGKLIGAALVGTFLGVFLAYGVVGPMANRLATVAREDGRFYAVIRHALIASLQNHGTAMCVEIGRNAAPATHRPAFATVEEALRALRTARG